MLFIIKLTLAMIKQKIDAVIKNFYFKLSANNITSSILKKFFLEKIQSNLKVDAPFFHSLIRETSGVQKINVTNSDKNMSNTTLLATKSREDCYFQHSRRKN